VVGAERLELPTYAL